MLWPTHLPLFCNIFSTESVSLNEAATTWSAGRDEQFIKNKSEKKKKMKEAKKEKKEKQRLSQKGIDFGDEVDFFLVTFQHGLMAQRQEVLENIR